MSIPWSVPGQTGSMLWRRVVSVVASWGTGTVVVLVVWFWPEQNVPPSMGPAVVVPALHGPTPSITTSPGPGSPAVAPPLASPGPACTCGGLAVQPSAAPEADDDEGGFRDGSGISEGGGAPRPGDNDEEEDDEDDEDEGALQAPAGDASGEEASGSPREQADDEWDD